MKKIVSVLCSICLVVLALSSVSFAGKPVSDTTAPVTTASPAAGTYATAQNVTLTRNEPAPLTTQPTAQPRPPPPPFTAHRLPLPQPQP